MTQEQKTKQTTTKAKPEADEAPESQVNEELAQDTEDLLDEIDDVLEKNAEEFVQAYVQKGGE